MMLLIPALLGLLVPLAAAEASEREDAAAATTDVPYQVAAAPDAVAAAENAVAAAPDAVAAAPNAVAAGPNDVAAGPNDVATTGSGASLPAGAPPPPSAGAVATPRWKAMPVATAPGDDAPAAPLRAPLAPGGAPANAARANGAPPEPTILDLEPKVVVRDFLYEGPFRRPSAVYCDARSGEMYVADPGLNMIGIFDENGVPLFAFSDDEHLSSPSRLVVDRDGKIYVLDADRSVIKIFSYRGEYLSAIDVAAAARQKVGITAFTLDDEGNLYLGDSANGQILMLDYRRDVKARFGAPGTGKGEFTSISGIAVDDSHVYVSDSLALGVQVFTRYGRFLGGWGIHEIGRANVSFPSGIAVDAKGRIVLVDQLRHDIKYFATDGRLIEQFGGLGKGPGEVANPADVSIGRDGRVCVAEKGNERIQVLSPVEGIPPQEGIRGLRGLPKRANVDRQGRVP